MCHLEEDHSPAILVNAVKLRLHVLVLLPGPLLDDWPGEEQVYRCIKERILLDVFVTKLFLGDPVVPLHVNLVEGLIELKSGPECLEEQPASG